MSHDYGKGSVLWGSLEMLIFIDNYYYDGCDSLFSTCLEALLVEIGYLDTFYCGDN